ncbi:hypothetical protein OK349_03850 [Sphingomonas sp. BT-65]|uniref:hypothetical protein n=1 Tax=Sphingomonas sp. BT-65 TaxID=2989821 RepID=UPI002235E47D|nr:hypothetical protein [Sphingomonas sp. BT-65]MCW4460827.1 hypothetical protein [Sphingomonas sp. BT-65]
MATSKGAAKEGGDDRRAKFVRIAEKRVGNAIRAIRLIGNLSNRAAYEFNDADVKKIAAALGKEIDSMQRRFSDTPVKNKIEFKL